MGFVLCWYKEEEKMHQINHNGRAPTIAKQEKRQASKHLIHAGGGPDYSKESYNPVLE